MKKSTLLSFATAAAIVVTSAGTYAAWDTLDATKTATVTIDKPVVVTMEDMAEFDKATTELGSLPSYTQDVTFNVADFPTEAEATYELTVEATSNQSEKVTVSAEKAASDLNTKIDGTHTYTVTVTPKDGVDAGGTQANVTVKAEILKK